MKSGGMGQATVTCALVCITWILSLCNGEPYLLFANHRDIQIIDATSIRPNSTVIISDLEDAAAVDFIHEDGSIYWTDVTMEVIYHVFLNDTRHPKVVVSTGLVSPDGLACDWLGRKLYWTDSETNRIEVSNLDGQYRKVLFWQKLDQPRAIALDPENGYMYWTDWGETPKIEKAGMDGNPETRTVLIEDNIQWPNGLTLDYEASKLYWADAKLNMIHSCDFDGKNRRAVIEGTDKTLPHPFALTLYEDDLYWTDWSTNDIHGCDKLTGTNCSVILEDTYAPMDIHAFMPNRQPKSRNMCGENNGGCSHLCLMSPISPYFSCACPTGVRLLGDNRICAKGAEKILFLARRQDIRQISLDTADYTDVVLQLSDIQHAIALDYDTSSGYIYWTDDEVKKIQRAKLDGSGQETVVSTEVDHPDGIAIDWIAKNLYWTDTGSDRIEVSRLNGTSRKVLISDGLDQPRAICLDPVAGYMYWSDWGKKPAIERAFLDGSHRTKIVSEGLMWPNGLAIDVDEQQLYWGDAKMDKIEVSDLDGRNRRTLIAESLPHIFGFSLLDDYIYWTDWQGRSIERVNKYTGQNRTTIIDQLPDLMGLRAIKITTFRGTNTCAHNNGNCSHLCLYLPPPQKRICACPMGLELRVDGRTCIVPEAFLLYSSYSDIRRISLEMNQNNQAIPIQGVQKAMAIDFDINDSRIYWTDGKLQHISRAFMNGSSLQHIIQFGLEFPEGMAVDWVAHNIYWADYGKDRIEVARLDGSSRKVLVWKNLKEPRALALDPPSGYMYWTVGDDQPALERANLDGTNRKVLISGIGFVQDLTIDYLERRLYWTNVDNGSIWSADMNGKDIKLIVQSDIQQPMGLTQYQDYIYWTDFENKSIARAIKTSGLNRTVIQSNVDYVMDILVFHASRQSGTNACGKDNGACSHLCLAHPVDESNNMTKHCACPTHYTLNEDGLTCSAPKQYLLMSTKNATIRLVMIESDSVVDNPEVVLPINNMKNIKALAYDPVGEYIYWVEGRQKIIKRAHDNGSMASTVVNDPENAFQPYDIAIDPYARTLYWTCTLNNVINVTRIDAFRSPIGVIMSSTSNFKPRSIVLYPEKGKMFFTNMVSSPRIETALMDGSERTTLFKNVLDHPQSLTIDTKENNLYWADPGLDRIEMSDLMGGNRKVLVDGQVGNLRGLAIYGTYLYWISKEQNFVERIHKKTGYKHLWVRGRIPGLSDLIAVEHSVSVNWHPCYHNNSGCSHICFIMDNQPRCSCPVHLVLKTDKQTCAEPPTCASDHFKCHSGGVQCIPMVWKCDFSSECEDNSDEENCVECTSGQFKCDNGECIDKQLKCNGHKDCTDASDEDDCCQKDDPDCTDCEEDGTCTTDQENPSSKQSSDGSKSPKDYTIAIVVVVLFLLVVFILILVCRHKSSSQPVDEDIVMVKKPLNPPLPPFVEGCSPPNTLSRGKSQATGISMASGSGPPFYDRNHVTGASSSSSTVTQYPQETLNPPPSPVTDRSVYTAPTGDVYMSHNSLSSSVQRSGGGGGGRRRNHHRRHHHHHHHHHHIPPPPTTPCSTDVCEDSEPYHHTTPLHTSTPANKYSGRSSRSRSSRSNAKKFKYYFNNSVMELNYDSDPFPPPPTPHSHYFSDEVSCPPSPSTERSYFNPYPPPPSPVATSDC